MDNFEKVEKLREHANVTYEEAKNALENSNWDILDAMIYLEQNGKVKGPEKSSYTTQTENIKIEVEDKKPEGKAKGTLRKFWNWCLKWIKRGNANSFCVDRYDREFELLKVLLENKNLVISRDTLLEKVCGYDYMGETNVIDVYVRYVRSKIDDVYNVKIIQTVRGVGYCIKEDY
jgi:hypothetical protein